MKFSNISISRKIAVSFGALVLACGAVSAVILVSLARIQEASQAQQASVETITSLEDMAKTMLDLSGQVRGFILTQDEDFAKGVADDYASVKNGLAALNTRVSNPEERRALEETAKSVEGYMNEAANDEIRYSRDATTLENALEIMKSGANKKWMNAFKAAEKNIETIEAAAREAGAAARNVAVFQSQLSIYSGGGVICGLAIGFGWLLYRQVSKPIVAIAGAMRKLAAGDVSIEVPEKGRSDEVGEIAGAVEVFKVNAIERIRAEQEAAAQRGAAETQRKQSAAERARGAEEQAEVVRRLGAGLKNLADGDLMVRLEGVAPAYAQIRDDFHEAIDKLKATILAVISSAGAIESGASEISAASDDLSHRSEQQAASLEETAATLNEVTATVNKSAEGASHAREVVATADADAKKSAVVVRQAVEAMDAIAKSSQEISQIIGVIDEIAFQTNLLALNAGVEAARAGDAGKGFAVVASEVRALAQRSADAAKQIKGLISESTTQVGSGVKLVAETGRSLERIMGQVAEINTVVADIAAGSKEQSTALQQINTAIEQMNLVTQQNASMVEQSTAAGHSLSAESSKLSALIGQFRVGHQRADEAPRRDLPRAAPRAVRPPARPAPAPKPKLVAAGGSAVSEGGWEQF